MSVSSIPSRDKCEPIAIIGMGCRFPGPQGTDVTTPEAFWDLLCSGEDIIRDVPASRWNIDDYYDPNPNAPGKMYVRKGYYLEAVDQFDPQFFNLAPREAASLDPQQRLVLEVSWETLEHAGIAPAKIRGSQTGVFVSTFWDDYSSVRLYNKAPQTIDRYATLSNLRSMVAGRLSHLLGVHGPTIQVDTACSASLTAVHLACQSLRNGECDLALAGGSYLLLTPEITIGLCRMGALAADGHSKAFAQRADGFGQGEGCGMVLLKRLSDAQAAGDTIWALIRGSAINHDGHSRTVTTPNGNAQLALLRQALQQADIAPHQVQYVETHGTGTELGDPIEVSAIAKAFCQDRSEPLAIGSVKTNIGHLNAAAGVAGLFKVVLAMHHQAIPPTLHIDQLNPRIPWQKLPITVPTVVTPWETHDTPRIAGLSSFGMSGSNAHILLQEAPATPPNPWPKESDRSPGTRPSHLLTLSAKTPEALQAQCQRYHDYLQQNTTADFADICYSANNGRQHFPHRLALIANSAQDACQQLAAAQGDFPLQSNVVEQNRAKAKIAFLFTGQGAQYVGMGRLLYETQPTFRQTLDHCDELLRAHLGESILRILYPDREADPSSTDPIDETIYTQPALFVLEYALATLWQSWGIKPDLLLGHSIGELVAACLAGVFSLEDGLKLVAARGQLMHSLPQNGAMVSLTTNAAHAEAAIAPYASEVSLAAINGPQSVVIAGKRETVQTIADQLAAEGIKAHWLAVSHAFHSPLMEPILAEFRRVAESITYARPTSPLISNVTGELATDEIATAAYWVRHIRQTVRFADGVQALSKQGVGICLEMGPKPILLGMLESINQQSQGAARPPLLYPTLRQKQNDWQQMLTTVAALYRQGVEIDWAGFDRDEPRHRVVLPTYPFQRQQCWIEADRPVRETEHAPSQSAAGLVTDELAALLQPLVAQGHLEPDQRTRISELLAKLNNANPSQPVAVQVEHLLYTVVWERAAKSLPLMPHTSQKQPPGRWVILSDSGGVGHALAAQMHERGEQVVTLPSPTLTSSPPDLQELASYLAPGADEVRGIIYLWGLNTTLSGQGLLSVSSERADKTLLPDALCEVDSLLQGQLYNCGNLLHLVQLLAAHPTQTKLWVVTQSAQSVAVDTSTNEINFTQTSLWGLGRVIAVEHPERWGGLIDLDPALPPSQTARQLAAELLKTPTDSEDQVAYRNSNRYLARLARSKNVRPAQKSPQIHGDATYLITGGLGALGLTVAQWLVDQGAQALILISRRGVTGEAQAAALRALSAGGAQVQIAQADVADAEAMQRLFAQIAAGTRPLKGVFHTAGVLDDGILLNQSWQRFANVMRAKVMGSWLLHQLTKDLDLDLMIFFSSLASLIGSPGQGNYAAANAFLDGLAHYRQQRGLAGLSINWGAWATANGLSGMAGRTPPAQAAFSQSLTPELGGMALEQLLSHSGQMGVAAIDWSQFASSQSTPFLAHWVTPSAPVASQTSLRQELEALPGNQRSEHLAKYLQQATQRILGLTDLPERTIGFTEMGMDSLMALELKRQLESALQLSLSATVAFEYPTIAALAHYLWQERLAPEQAPEVTHSVSPTSSLPSAKYISEPIAIIGMGCRFPGADSPAAFWQLLCNGSDQVREIPSSRWAADDYYDPQRPMPGKMYTRQAAFLDQVDQFDPGFFGISPRETISMDPQHRLLLEVSWEALEDAGIAPASLIDSQTGVFVGIGSGDYGGVNHTPDLTSLDAYVATGNGHSIAAGRLAYTLGLQGPTLAVDTACSSSLVALHLACQSLRNGECNLALAGGVHLLLSPNGHIVLSQLQALAPDGRCKTFAASADGYGRGEGCGIVVLKPLTAAQAAGDPILAVIKGSAVNHDGPSSGLTVPNKRAQEKLLRQALHNAQLMPDAVAYIEAHGTGTPLGDPLELRALNAVYGFNRTTPLLVGSVKTNIGHLEAAAGVASLIKTVMALHHEQIPPHLHFTAPNPYVEWDELAVTVPTTLQPWPAPAGDQERIAGVSSFGLSGTNAHVIVASAPALPQSINQPAADTNLSTPSSALFPLSAKSSAALSALATRYAHFLADEPQLDLVDLCHTAATGRNHFRHRLAIIANSTVDLQSRLSQVAAQGLFAANAPNALYTSAEQSEQASPRLAFLFTGQGAQYSNMGRQLYASAPVFRQALDRCAEILQPLLPAPDGTSSALSLLSLLYPDPTSTATPINDTAYTQPVLFALEYALTQLWRSWGIEPEIVLGHSVGEYVAACVAGVFSLEDALRLVAARGRLMSALPADGAMLAVLTNEARVQNALLDYAQRTGRPNDVALAAINAPNNVVISGQRQAVQMIADALASEGVTSRRLTVSHAFHSPLMTPMLDEFRQVAATITYHAPTLPLISNLTGQLAGAEIATPDYWVHHISAPVRFAASIQAIQAQGLSHWLEIGPKPTLLNLAQQCLDQMTAGPEDKVGERHPVLLASLHPMQSDWQQLLASLATLYTAGAVINWPELTQAQRPHKLVLPTYPFQRQRYWQAAPKPTPMTPALRPLIDRQINVPLHKQTLFEKDFSLQSLPFLADHHVYGAIVTPGACHLALALSVAELLLGGAACQLDDVIFPQALMLGTDDPRTVQCSVDAAIDASGAAFRIISFTNTEQAEPPTHATGRITPLTQPAPVVSLPDLQLRCQQPLLPADLYEAIQASQVTLGPTFRWFVALWQGEGDEALAHLQLPDALSDVQGYPLFPSLIDACFQVVGAATLGQLDHTQTTRLPFALTALTRYQASDQRDLWCHASSTDGQHWTIVLFTASGAVIAQIRGFQMRPVPPAAIYGNRLRTDWLYTQRWQASPLLRASAPTSQPACWLIMGGATGISTTLTARLQATGAAIVLATCGSRYELTWTAEAGLTAQAVLDPLAPEMFQSLLTTLAARYQTLGIAYLWGYDPTALAIEPAATPDSQTLRLTSGLLHLTQALIATHVPATLTVVTTAAQLHQLAEPDTHHPNPFDQEKLAWLAAAGALWGLGRTITLEHPQLSCTCLDLQNGSADLDSAALFGELVQKAFPQGAVSAQKLGTPSPTGETQILYHQQVRYVARIASWQPPTPTARHAISIGADGCYLITGGLGGLGWQVAEQLVAEGARQLVLSSRQPAITPTLEQQIVRWQSEGVQVHVIAADVSDATDLERLLAACQTIAPLRGIVHAAGVLDDALLVDQSSARLATVMQAKVSGSWQLHCQTLHLPLDFFICFSSAASWLGSAGQGNYAAANAFMDTLMQQRRLLGLCGTTINWSGWAEVGMAARQANPRAMLAQPFQPLALTQARQLFGYLLKQNALQVGVCDLNQTGLRGHTTWVRLFQPVLGTVADAPNFAPATQSLYTELAPLPARQRYDQLFQHLHGQVARILRLPTAEQIAARQPLFEMGLDSLMALELKNQLQAALPVTLHATLLFDYPTLAQLTGYLCEQLWEQVPETNGIEITPATDAPVEQGAANLSELSGYELLDLLKQLKETA